MGVGGHLGTKISLDDSGEVRGERHEWFAGVAANAKREAINQKQFCSIRAGRGVAALDCCLILTYARTNLNIPSNWQWGRLESLRHNDIKVIKSECQPFCREIRCIFESTTRMAMHALKSTRRRHSSQFLDYYSRR